MRDITTDTESIYELQTMLRELHYAKLGIPLVNPDGIYGEETADAVRAFQRSLGLAETGRVDFALWQKLYAAYLSAKEENAPPKPIYPFPSAEYRLREGERSDTTAFIQLLLRTLADIYDEIGGKDLDGIYSEATAADIRAFQKVHGLEQTGETDRSTWDALADAYNRHFREVSSQ